MKGFYRNEGFTLIEMLVSLILLSIILASVYSTFFLSRRAIDGYDESLLKLQECRAALDMMGREMESIPPYRASNKNLLFKTEDRDVYGKSASRFTFTSFSPLTPGLAAISYFAEEKDGVMTLFKKIKSVSDTGDPAPTEVIDGVEAFSIEVLNNGKWIKTWNAAETGLIPDEIRITINIKVKDKPLAITQTVSPKAGKAI